MPNRQVEKLLRALAERGAHLEGSLNVGSNAVLRLLSRTGGESHGAEQRTFSARVVRSAVDAGYIVSDGGRRLLLSPAGRAELRRRRSQLMSANDAIGDGLRHAAPVLHAGTVPGPGPGDCTLAWLRLRKDKSGQPLITDVELAAGQRLRADYERALASPRVTSEWGGISRRDDSYTGNAEVLADLLDRAMASRYQVERALVAVDPEIASLLLDVCCHGIGLTQCEKARSWPQRSSKLALRIGLRSLARHYGLTNDPSLNVFPIDQDQAGFPGRAVSK